MYLPVLMFSFSLFQTKPAQPAQAMPSGFLYKTLTLEGEIYAYCVFVPPNYTPDKPWPVILFLHGSGERGSDGFLQTDVGLGRALRRNWQLVPAIVVMPQCRAGQGWVGLMTQVALRCVEETAREYRLDPARVYLTGLSMGGQGAWHLAASFPERFAAVLVICGFAELGESTAVANRLAPGLVGIPIRCFHGAKDANVPVSKAREMVAAIRRAGGHVEYTEYPEGDHFIWDRLYDSPEVWRWLFSHALGSGGTSGQRAG